MWDGRGDRGIHILHNRMPCHSCRSVQTKNCTELQGSRTVTNATPTLLQGFKKQLLLVPKLVKLRNFAGVRQVAAVHHACADAYSQDDVEYIITEAVFDNCKTFRAINFVDLQGGIVHPLCFSPSARPRVAFILQHLLDELKERGP